jgi:two-component system, NtrC family, sensor kinase
MQMDESKKILHQFNSFYNFQNTLSTARLSSPFEDIQKFILQEIPKLLDCEACAFILFDNNHKEWMIQKSLGEDGEFVYQINPRDGTSLIRECLKSNNAFFTNTVAKEKIFDLYSDSINNQEAHSLACAPFFTSDKVKGALQVTNKKLGDFSRTDLQILYMSALLVGSLFEENRLTQELELTKSQLETSHAELNHSKNLFLALFGNLPTPIYIIDRSYKITAINTSRRSQLGKSQESLIGKHCYKALFKRNEPCLKCSVSETFENGSKTQRNERRTYEISGETSEWEISSYPIFSDNKEITHAILIEEDMTERNRLEATLAQSDKLVAIGQLAAGIAHEISNPLTAIIANAQILHRELKQDENLLESVDLISRAGARAAQVVQNLLDFSRKDEYHLEITDINETIEKALALVQHELIARGVLLEFHPQLELPPIYASQDHLQSIWLNLLLNAIDSIDKQYGKIEIKTKASNKEIQVTVKDNGKGISPENLTRVFEPFYTTKAPGRGTGLGLSVSHRIVKQHEGSIQIQSTVGTGTTFIVTLPVK